MQSFVLTKHFTIGINDVAWFVFDVIFEKTVNIHIAEKADALAIFLLGIRELVLYREIAHRWFGKFTNGEDR